MGQDEINESEWRNPDNWGGPKWIAVYFSKNDSRTWVPKRVLSLGWTMNLAHTPGVYWLTGVMVGVPLFLIAVFGFIFLFVIGVLSS